MESVAGCQMFNFGPEFSQPDSRGDSHHQLVAGRSNYPHFRTEHLGLVRSVVLEIAYG